MACQGIGLNGGEGGNIVNPMDVGTLFWKRVKTKNFYHQVQSRCPTCNCLVPDLVFDEHRQTCWAKSDTKRVNCLFFSFASIDLLFPTESGYSDGK